MKFTVGCLRRLVNTVCLIRLYNRYYRAILAIHGSEESGHCPGHGTDSGLEENMSRLLRKLHVRFISHRSVSLHDPTGNILISLPRSILNHHPALLFRLAVGKPDGFIIVEVGDGCICALCPDIHQAFFGAALRHVYHRFLLKLFCCPGNSPAVVAVSRSDKCNVAKLPFNFS